MNKKGDILHEQVIFIILNIIFFSVMILFIYLQGSSIHLSEEKTAKQIALIIDGSKSGSEIQLNLKDFFEKSEISKESSVIIDNDSNKVVVKGSKDSSYDYHYFNDVDVEYNFQGDYLILIIK